MRAWTGLRLSYLCHRLIMRFLSLSFSSQRIGYSRPNTTCDHERCLLIGEEKGILRKRIGNFQPPRGHVVWFRGFWRHIQYKFNQKRPKTHLRCIEMAKAQNLVILRFVIPISTFYFSFIDYFFPLARETCERIRTTRRYCKYYLCTTPRRYYMSGTSLGVCVLQGNQINCFILHIRH